MKNNAVLHPDPVHYGKWVLTKGFNDSTIVAYGPTIIDLKDDADNKGWKVVGTPGDENVGVSMYCYAPCESMMGISTLVDTSMVNGGCNKCPVCKYRDEED